MSADVQLPPTNRPPRGWGFYARVIWQPVTNQREFTLSDMAYSPAPARLLRKITLVEPCQASDRCAVHTLTFANPPGIDALGVRIYAGDVVKVCRNTLRGSREEPVKTYPAFSSRHP